MGVELAVCFPISVRFGVNWSYIFGSWKKVVKWRPLEHIRFIFSRLIMVIDRKPRAQTFRLIKNLLDHAHIVIVKL